MSGAAPLLNVFDYERAAAARLDAGALGYFAGGAGDEHTLRDNVEAFTRWKLRPRVLVDVGDVTTAATVLGERVSAPILVAPTAFHRLAHPDGEQATARGAAAAGTIMCVSTLATASPEEVAAAAPDAARWFQLYWYRDREVTRALLDRVVAAGYRALVLTVDLPGAAGRRERDLRAAFELPPDLPVPNIEAVLGEHRRNPHATIGAMVDPTLTWRDLEWLRDVCPRPLAVKGVLTAEDAVLAVEHGADAVVVSNHGGRQLDGAVASLDALPEVVDAVGGRCEVLVDGGVRRGSHVAVALALGARAVLVGRPVLWGLAAAGAEGVGSVLGILREELELTLRLLGCASPAQVTRAHVR